MERGIPDNQENSSISNRRQKSGNTHIVYDKAVLMYRGCVYSIEEEDIFSYKDITEKIKSCSTSSQI